MDSMQRRRLPRSVLYVLVASLVLIVVGNVIPPLVIASLKPVAIGTEYTYRTAPASADLFDVASYQEGHIPAANQLRSECTAKAVSTVPLSCFVIPVELTGERTTRTLPGKNKKYAVVETNATLHATAQAPDRNTAPNSQPEGTNPGSTKTETRKDTAVRGVDKVVMSLEDTAVLIRHSGYAEAEPSSHTRVELPFVGVELRKDNYVRDGLQYVFPFTAKRISYPYWDVIAQRATALDYVDPVDKPNGFRVWEYAQTLTAVPLDSTLEFRGPASQYFTAQELKDRQLSKDSTVTLSPFYFITRRVQIEPKTGIMTDYSAEITVALDLDQNTAKQTAQQTPVGKSRTLFHGSQNWYKDTQDAAFQRVRPIVGQLKMFQVLSYISSTLMALLLLWAAWQLIQWRRRRIRAHATTPSADD